MRVLAENSPILRLDSVDSTQKVAIDLLRRGEPVGAVQALEQTQGKGRFGRPWHSPSRDCLAVSLVLSEHAGHPKPYLLGMALAVAAARAFSIHVQWPNDLVYAGKKLGGILTEVVAIETGRSVPVLGIGINLNQETFPEDIQSRATSLRQLGSEPVEPDDALTALIESARQLPEPQSWDSLRPYWMEMDETPGKRYRQIDGSEVWATGIGPNGELLHAGGVVLAADAILG